MLVAAGLGTRLDPLTRELPKPAMPVGNRPIAWYACDHLARNGVSEIVVNTHHLAAELRSALEPHCPDSVRLSFVHEPVILGTGGGVRNAWQPVDGEDIVVMNAKLLFAPDLGRALEAHRQSEAIATMIVRPLPAGSGFSAVEIDAQDRVRRIRGLPRSASPSSSGLSPRMWTSVQILSARAHRDLPESGDIIEQAYWRWLERGELVASVTEHAPWHDVGVTPRDYLQANLALASGSVRWPGIAPDARGVIADAHAELGTGSRLALSCVGEQAVIANGASLTRVVVWPGAHAGGELEDAVVTTAGRVVAVGR